MNYPGMRTCYQCNRRFVVNDGELCQECLTEHVIEPMQKQIGHIVNAIDHLTEAFNLSIDWNTHANRVEMQNELDEMTCRLHLISEMRTGLTREEERWRQRRTR